MPTDYWVNAVIEIFWLASRGRSYLSAMAIIPLPLTVAQISDVLAVYPLPFYREWIDKAVFAIDDEYLSMVQDICLFHSSYGLVMDILFGLLFLIFFVLWFRLRKTVNHYKTTYANIVNVDNEILKRQKELDDIPKQIDDVNSI